MGAYKDRIEAADRHLSPDQIRAKKIARCKSRGIERRATRRARAEAIDARARR